MAKRISLGSVLLAAGIGVTAAGLRLWRVTWGLPEQMGFADELVSFNLYASCFVPLSTASFTQRSFLYPTFYGYLLGLGTSLYYLVGGSRVPLGVSSPETFIIGRAISALMGVVTVGVVGFTGGQMYGRRIGFVAAALMAVVPLHVLYSHIASTDLTLCACAAAAVACAYAAARGGSRLLVFAAGFAAGLAFSTKYTGLAMLVPIGWAVLERTVRDGLGRGVRLGVLGLLGFAVAVVIACPWCAFNPRFMLEGIRILKAETSPFMALGATNNHLVPSLGWYGRPYLYQLFASLPFVLGWPLYVLAAIGVGLAIVRRELADRVLLVTTVAYFLVIAGSAVTFPRYLLPIVPGLVILAARAGGALPGPRAVSTAVVGAVFAYSLAVTASQVARFSYDQQHDVARFIRAALPPGVDPRSVRVGVPNVMLDYYRVETPLAAEGLRRVHLADGHWFDALPDFIVLPEWLEISIVRDAPTSALAADLVRLRSGDAGYRRAKQWRSTYLQQGFYTWLDPGFAVDLWQGEIGFTVYVRERRGWPAT